MKKLFTKNFGITKIKNAKRILTFRTFLVILAGGIMFTACKKEDLKPSNNSDISCNFKLLKQNVSDNGFVGDLYENTNDGKMLFIINESTNSPKMELTKNYVLNSNGCFRCDGSSDECEVDNVRAIVYVRKGADPKK
ncbi:MAG: hypothetical protein GYA62_01365 [Bacteroidales bacterium]|jgi:hypothetical protein|nr:hypothetical protein [Bacteroidales bacterium]